jgi:hypothetical protein
MMTMSKAKFYVGCKPGEWHVFKSDIEPTTETHGRLYNACIGPFRTKRGAEFMRKHGKGNPHCQTVAQAERLAKQYATEGAAA